MAKSNSAPATNSIAGEAASADSRATATWAPTKPMRSDGFASRSASATFTSCAKDGALVWSTARSYCRASGSTSSRLRPAGGASTRREPGTSAAGWASHVGYQNERTSRRAW